MSMLIEVWGSYGCFTRPEMKTERVSYDMPTPSAARGLSLIHILECLAAGHFPDGVLIQRRQLCPQKLLAQQLTPPRKAPPDEGRILYRAADIHGKACLLYTSILNLERKLP